MDQIKAKEVQICVFTWQNLPSANDYTGDERAMFDAFAGVIGDLRARHGANVPVFLDFCSLTNPTNQVIASNLGITDFPGVQVFATYPDGSQGQYAVVKDLQDKLTGVNWTPDDVRGYVEGLLYQRKPAKTSILCELFPPLCQLGGWIWLAAAGYSTLRAIESPRTVGKVIWGAAAGLTWQSFFAAGGFKKLGIAGNERWKNPNFGPKIITTKTLNKFGEAVKNLENVTDGDVELVTKHQTTLVEKRGGLYIVTKFNSGKATRRDMYNANTFEENYRWYI